ncbi:chemotaxis protein CheW [Burkholderiaceae bacterium DAT-1]|nr:chemotaxis protein CheW [Burkholderiaceae bacterium DAT-1]
MQIDMSEFIQTFFEEASEHLASMESLLLALNLESPEAEDLNAIFRAAHSIKGGAATFGFDDLKDVTHILENQLDRVRKGTLALRSDMVDTFLEAGDALKAMLQAHQQGEEADASVSGDVCRKLHALEADGHDAPPSAPQSARWCLAVIEKMADQTRQDMVVNGLGVLGWVRDETSPDSDAYLLLTPDSREQIIESLAFLMESDAFSLERLPDDIESFGLFDPIKPALSVDDGFGMFDAAPADDGFGLFVDEPQKDEGFGLFVELAKPAADEGFGLFDTSSGNGGTDLAPAKDDGFGLFEPSHGQVQKPPAASASTPAPAPMVERRATPRPATEAGNAPESSSIRVAVEKVDQIINLVGELVITQAMLAQVASELDPAQFERLNNGVALLERNTRELQESAMSIRMMPISFVFSRFPRVVRDTAAKLGKKVRLLTQGESTELDRGLIERLSDPLTHLVRNSLDHGIEAGDVRLAKGKDEQGTLSLRAFHQGGNIIIQVQDDGAGLNRDRILAKARSQGMNVSDDMADGEVWGLIFEPGFSTAEVVTDVSGRGVGMDVVRRNIQGMGGRIDIESIKDIGTTMTIRLPLTLAILDGMAVNVDGEVYVIPLAFIVESLQPRTEDIKTIAGKGRVVNVRGEYLPIISLRNSFNSESEELNDCNALFVIVESEMGKTALVVDDLMGQHQIVIKSLETNFRKVAGISGATVMGDGRVALIVDVESLVRLRLQSGREKAVSHV